VWTRRRCGPLTDGPARLRLPQNQGSAYAPPLAQRTNPEHALTAARLSNAARAPEILDYWTLDSAVIASASEASITDGFAAYADGAPAA
jgi:hypothetical protein